MKTRAAKMIEAIKFPGCHDVSHVAILLAMLGGNVKDANNVNENKNVRFNLNKMATRDEFKEIIEIMRAAGYREGNLEHPAFITLESSKSELKMMKRSTLVEMVQALLNIPDDDPDMVREYVTIDRMTEIYVTAEYLRKKSVKTFTIAVVSLITVTAIVAAIIWWRDNHNEEEEDLDDVDEVVEIDDDTVDVEIDDDIIDSGDPNDAATTSDAISD